MTVVRSGVVPLMAPVVAAVTAALLLLIGGAGPAAADPVDGAGRELVLTNADNGRVLSVPPGETVVVRLTGMVERNMVWAWSEPTASVPRVLRRGTAGTAPRGDAWATFRAVAPGVSDIGAYRHCVPDPGVMCARIAIPWKVTVTAAIG